MAEPYKRIGRGGAGNFYGPKDVEDASKTAAAATAAAAVPSPFLTCVKKWLFRGFFEDLEAQTSPTTTNDLTRSETSAAPPPEYQHIGRGGAGNWMKPSELESRGFSQEHDSTLSATSTAAVSGTSQTLGGSKPAYRGGRGGAGNYTDVEGEAREKREESLRREMESRAARDVEAGLARPPNAYNGIGGVWEMGDMK